MKKLHDIKVLFLSIILLISWGCNKLPEAIQPDLTYAEVGIPDNLKFTSPNGKMASSEVEIEEIDVVVVTKDGEEISGTIRFTMPSEDENTLSKFEMTNNIFNETALTPDFWTNYEFETNSSGSRLTGASCTADCQKEFTDSSGNKIKGRGACKAECWAKVIIAAAAVVVAALAIK